jgi:ATP-dependent Lon protease
MCDTAPGPFRFSAIRSGGIAMSDHTDETPEIVTSEVGPDTSDERPTPIPAELPVLPLRDTVLFPNSFMPLAVARESSVRLIDEAIAGGKLIGVFAQRDPALDEPIQADLYEVGTATHIHKMFRLPDGSLRLIVQGLSRIHLDEIVAVKPYLRAAVSAVNDNLKDEDRLEIDALLRNIKSNFQKVVSLSPLLSDDLQTLAMNIEEPARLADFIASSLSTISTATKQEVLETLDIRARMDSLNRILIKELEVLELGSKIQSQVQSEVGRNQREYFLREQLKAIQKELGEDDDQQKEIAELREKIDAAGMPEAVLKEANRELDRLSRMPVAAAEYTVSRTYLDWLIALPWNARTDEVIDLVKTKRTLDADHSGLDKAKDRILEYLAVRKLNPEMKGPILCFVGPPGVGKTSMAKSIATSLGRKFVRCRSAACATRPRSAAIAGRTSARCRARSSRACAEPSRRTRCSSWTRSTSWGPISAAIRAPRFSRCSTPSRTTRSAITTSTCRSISPRCCSSPRPT